MSSFESFVILGLFDAENCRIGALLASLSPAKIGVLLVAIACGNVNVMAAPVTGLPEVPLTRTSFAVPWRLGKVAAVVAIVPLDGHNKAAPSVINGMS